MTRVQSVSARVGRWVPVVCRAVAVSLTAYPPARKFLQYSDRVERFAAWGFPLPELAVLLSGVVEVVAIVSDLVGLVVSNTDTKQEQRPEVGR
jgi:uncharacterized membrane protein YphA (DoxX/SURF4 family)